MSTSAGAEDLDSFSYAVWQKHFKPGSSLPRMEMYQDGKCLEDSAATGACWDHLRPATSRLLRKKFLQDAQEVTFHIGEEAAKSLANFLGAGSGVTVYAIARCAMTDSADSAAFASCVLGNLIGDRMNLRPGADAAWDELWEAYTKKHSAPSLTKERFRSMFEDAHAAIYDRLRSFRSLPSEEIRDTVTITSPTTKTCSAKEGLIYSC